MTTPTTTVSAGRGQALRDAAHARTARAVTAAEHGIRTLLKDGGQISFQSVARASGVSTKFLHSHPDLAPRIRHLRDQTRHAIDDPNTATPADGAGESAIISALRRQLRDQKTRHDTDTRTLRATVKNLENQIARLHGELASRS